jgi:hypothetical protein
MADQPQDERPPDSVIVWELDPDKPLTAYWVRYGGNDFGRFADRETAMARARREAAENRTDVWFRRGNAYRRVWIFSLGAATQLARVVRGPGGA